MARKAVVTDTTRRAIQYVLGKSDNSELCGLARSFADVQNRSDRISIAVIHSKHLEMLQGHISELEELFGKPVVLEHLTMLEQVYKQGVDLKWHLPDH